MIAYLYDDKLRSQYNDVLHGNYWDAYIEEICGLLGIKPHPVSLNELNHPRYLEPFTTFIIGNCSGKELTDPMAANIKQWVRDGGLLIGFALKHLEDVFGIEVKATIAQPLDDYTIAGHIELLANSLTHQIHPFHYQEQKLLALSDIQLIKNIKAVTLANLYGADNKSLSAPAITWNKFGQGHAGYFAFDVAKTIWLLHQGRPLAVDKIGHTSQLSVIGPNSRKVPYADELAFLIQNMIAQCGHQPFVYQIPPRNNSIPDALFYWGGDEYRGPSELSVKASDWMKEKGLPYHINIEIDKHPMTVAELKHIQQNGHEVSLYHYLAQGQTSVNQAHFQKQSDLLYEKFGYRPGSTLFHNTHWQGWAEPARWMAEAGCGADNSFMGRKIDRSDPYVNGPLFMFGSGAGYPFNFYDDSGHENRRIPLVEQPIVWYELGHRGSMPPHFDDRTTRAVDEVHFPIDLAVKYHLVINIFYHPVYIVNHPPCRDAIEEVLAYIKRCGYHVVHMTNNQAAAWWNKRNESEIKNVKFDGYSIRFDSRCAYDSGMIVKIPLNGKDVKSVSGNLACEKREEFGNTWLFIALPKGAMSVKIELKDVMTERLDPMVVMN